MKRVQMILHPNAPQTVRYFDQVSKYVSGGAGGVGALCQTLNSDPVFARDGVNLDPTKIVPNPKVHDIVSALGRDYFDLGWEVRP